MIKKISVSELKKEDLMDMLGAKVSGACECAGCITLREEAKLADYVGAVSPER